MNKARHAFRIARRYAEGGSDDEQPLHQQFLGATNPVHNAVNQRGVLQVDPLQGGAGGAGPLRTEPAPAPKEEIPAPAAPIQGPAEKPSPQTGVEHLWQAIADHLVGRHGDDYGAAESAIRNLASNYSQRAADAVWSKMPLEHQMGMMASGMQTDLGPAAYRIAIQQNQEEAAQLQGAQESGSRVPTAQRPPISEGVWDKLNTPNKLGDEQSLNMWLANASPHQVQHLSEKELNTLSEHFNKNPEAWTDLKNENPELLSAIGSEMDHRYGSAADRQLDKEYRPLTEEEYAAGPESYGAGREHLAQGAANVPPPTPAGWVHGSQHPFNMMSEGFLDKFNKDVAPKTGDKSVYDFAKRFFGGFDTKRINANASDALGELHLSGNLYDNGKHVAEISRMIAPGDNHAHHSVLEVADNYKGVAGPRILRGNMDTYKALDLDHVSVQAGLDGGGIAWAKYGFLPNAQDWNRIRKNLSSYLGDDGAGVAHGYYEYKLDNPRDLGRLRRILEWPNPRGMWALADLQGTVNKGEQTIGNALLANSNWGGTFHLKDPDSMHRFDSYVEKKIEKAKLKKPPTQ